MREGLLSTMFGTAVLATGAMLKGADMERRGMHKRDVLPLMGALMVGYGLASVIMGTKDLMEQ